MRSNVNRVLFIAVSLFFAVTSSLYANNKLELTADEVDKLNAFARSIPVDKGVGQFFMINLPTNYVDSFNRRNWREVDKTPIHKKLIEQGFGSVLLQKSNFLYLNSQTETEEERISLITGFVNNLQYRAISKKNKGLTIPLFIAVDFEGPLVTTIKNTLIAPPPALTLAATQNKKLIEKTGKIIGYQLANSGINMLLGPVLDIDKTVQGNNNRVLKNRSFSSHADSVIATASYYTKGLREAGITVIGKHFPGLGFVDGDPHNKIVSFQGTTDDLKEHLTPYKALQPLLNGIMTSHVSLSFLDDKQPATFNRSIIQFIRNQTFDENESLEALTYNNKLVLTDDLGMDAITDYGKAQYGRMTVKAFEAGHDIILFAKVIAEKDVVTKGTIRISELIKVKERLATYLKRPENKKKYIASLQRVIQAKAASYKLHGGNIEHFITGNMNKVIRTQLSIPLSVKGIDGFIDYEKVKDAYEEIIEESYLLLNGIPPYSIRKKKGVCLFSPEKYHDNYRGMIGFYEEEKFYLSNVLHKNDKKLKDKINNIKQDIKNNNCEILYVVINNGLNIKRVINIVDYLTTLEEGDEQDKTHLVLLLHQNPIALPRKILDYKNLTVMGAFTQHDISYRTDVKIIKGDIRPKKSHNLTIDYDNNIFTSQMEKIDSSMINLDYTVNNVEYSKQVNKLNEEKQQLEEKLEKKNKEVKQEKEKEQQQKQQIEEAFNDKNIELERLERKLKIYEKNRVESGDKINSQDKGYYKGILLMIIIITGIIITLYVTDKSRGNISRVSNSKDATFVLLKSVLLSPQLVIVVLFFVLVIFLFIAHLNDLSLHELLKAYLK